MSEQIYIILAYFAACCLQHVLKTYLHELFNTDWRHMAKDSLFSIY